MRKVRLDPESLCVTTFATDTLAEGERGTVLGQGKAQGTGPVDSCGGTCYDTECFNEACDVVETGIG